MSRHPFGPFYMTQATSIVRSMALVIDEIGHRRNVTSERHEMDLRPDRLPVRRRHHDTNTREMVKFPEYR